MVGYLTNWPWAINQVKVRQYDSFKVVYDWPENRELGQWLLIVDGHESHMTPEFLGHAWNHQISVYMLPAHTTHWTQPLDIGLLGPLQHWVVDQFSRGGGIALAREDFEPLLYMARKNAYTFPNIKRPGARQDLFHSTVGCSWATWIVQNLLSKKLYHLTTYQELQVSCDVQLLKDVS